MKKKKIFLGVSLLACAVALASCAKTGESGNVTSGQNTTNVVTTTPETTNTTPTTTSTNAVTPETTNTDATTPTTNNTTPETTVVVSKYTVAWYNENGEQIKADELEEGAQIVAPTAPTKDNTAEYTYAFDGWYTAQTEGEKVTDFGTVSGDVTYYARFTSVKNQYTYTFYAEDGTTELKKQTVDYGTAIAAPSTPTKPADTEYIYTFDGWYTEPTGGEEVTSFGNIEGNVSFYARFERALKITVTFMSEGVEYKTVDIKTGSKVTKPADPTKAGYYLAYWEKDGAEFDFNTVLDSDTTLTAKFEEIKETENIGFGTGYTAFSTIASSFTGKDAKNRPQLTADLVAGNFTFRTKALLDSNNTVLNTQGTAIDVVLPTRGSISLAGTWGSSDAGKVYIYLVEGTTETLVYTSSSSYSSKGAVSITLDSLSLQPGTYRIRGLKDKDSTGASLALTKITYERIVEKVNVNFITNNGESIDSVLVKKGTTLTELPSVVRSGFKFIGWYTTEDFQAGSEFELTDTINGETNLYAKWEELTNEDIVTISFNVNVAGQTIESIDIEKGTSLAALPVLNIEGYRLNGWFTNDSYNQPYLSTMTFIVDTTLFAEYIKTYNVVFLDNDGNEIRTVTVDDDTLVTEKISKPYIAGYKFDYWYNTANDQEFDITTEHISSDLVLRAHYSVDTNPVALLALTKAEGAEESAYVTFSAYTLDSTTATEYAVFLDDVLLTSDSVYISNTGTTYRADLFGIKAGNHTISVAPIIEDEIIYAAKSLASSVVVDAYDRSGYAHFNYDEGVGAYKDDGTLKENAIVLYVTNENKNTITLEFHDSINNKDYSVTGIGNILNSAGKDTGSGTNSKGGKANTNAGCILALAQNNIPLVVRFIGCVSESGLGKPGTYSAADAGQIDGLTDYDGVDYGGSVGDNGHMARMQSGKNITFEGVGDDAIIDGWGFHLICESAYSDLAKNFEVRNLTFINTPEDGIGMEGQEVESTMTLTAAVERCWVHHNTFLKPTISSPAESDKSEGDGSCDFKRGRYFTCSYNYFENCHKTNLVGSGKASVQYCMTYHHNLWYNCAARQPLARKGNIHFYNNYIIGTTDTVSSLRADCYMFAEANYYLGCSRPVEYKAEGTTGVCKAFNNAVIGCYNNYDATDVTSREQTITANCKDNATNINYSTFDTDSTLFYYDSTNNKSDCYLTDANQARIDCVTKAGSRYRTQANNCEYKTSTDITSEASSATVSGATSLTIAKGKGVLKVFTVTSPVIVTMAAEASSGFDTGYLLKKDGTVVLELSASSQSAVLMPGEYVVISCVAFSGSNGKNDKETTIKTCTFEPYDSEELNAQLIAQYEAAHDALPATIEYSNQHYQLIKSAMDAYKALGSDLQSRITNYADVTAAYEAYKSAGITYVEGLINQIELPVTASNSTPILAARAAYNTLIARISDVTVSNYSTLIAAEDQMSSLAVDIFLNAVKDIPSTIIYTSECNNAISNAEAAYANLDEDQVKVSSVISAYNTMLTARAQYNNLEAAYVVQSLIDSANDLESYEAAYNAYNELTTVQREYIVLYDEMLVDYVTTLIQSISSPVTAADAPTINKARAVYEELSDDVYKQSVTNYSTLVAAEETLASVVQEYTKSWSTSEGITGKTGTTADGFTFSSGDKAVMKIKNGSSNFIKLDNIDSTDVTISFVGQVMDTDNAINGCFVVTYSDGTTENVTFTFNAKKASTSFSTTINNGKTVSSISFVGSTDTSSKNVQVTSISIAYKK